MWNKITSNQDIINFMELISGFHDSCIKELRYYSGAYVDKDLSMYTIISSADFKQKNRWLNTFFDQEITKRLYKTTTLR